jgi:hypothetical protein
MEYRAVHQTMMISDIDVFGCCIDDTSFNQFENFLPVGYRDNNRPKVPVSILRRFLQSLTARLRCQKSAQDADRNLGTVRSGRSLSLRTSYLVFVLELLLIVTSAQ